MIIEMDDREIEVDEEDLSSLLEMLNKQYDPTIIMMTKFESALTKASQDISSAIKTMPQPASMQDIQVTFDSEALPKLINSVDTMLKRMSKEVVMAVKSIPQPTSQEPVKRIVVGYIERGNNGLIKSCVLDVER